MMKNFNLFMLGMTTAICSATIVRAACAPAPDCAAVGYGETSCPTGAKVLRCPTDISKVKCVVHRKCEDSGYKSKIPDNNKCTEVIFAGSTCYKDCYQPTCEQEGYKAFIPAEQTCTRLTSFGRTCYKNCRPLSCEEKGKVTCNGTCIEKGQCCTDSNCKSGYYCNSHSCSPCVTGHYYYSDRTCNPVLDNAKTLVGIVLDGSQEAYVMSFEEWAADWNNGKSICASYSTVGTSPGQWTLPPRRTAGIIYKSPDKVDKILTALGKPKIFSAEGGPYGWTDEVCDDRNALVVYSMSEICLWTTDVNTVRCTLTIRVYPN